MKELSRFGRGINKGVKSARRFMARGLLRFFEWDDLPLIQATGLKGEKFEKTEWFQHWGFASRPNLKAELIIVPVGGANAHHVVIASADPDNPCPVDLETGEAALFNDQGSYIHLNKDGDVIIRSDSVLVYSSLVEFHQES